MRQQKDRNTSRKINRWVCVTSISCWFSLIFLVPIFGQNADRDKNGWRATIVCDSAAVYSHMSNESSKLKFLKKGEAVIIDLEIIGSDGAWCSVREHGQRLRLGYIQSECLEWNRPVPKTMRQVESPSSLPTVSSSSESVMREEAAIRKSSIRNEIKEQVESAVEEKINGILRMTPANDLSPSEKVEFDKQEESFLFFLPANIAHQRVPFIQSHGSFINRLNLPVIPATPNGLFCTPSSRPPVSTPFGAHFMTHSSSRRR